MTEANVYFSKETLAFFAAILDQMQMPVGHPEFEQKVAVVIGAKHEMAQALSDVESEPLHPST